MGKDRNPIFFRHLDTDLGAGGVADGITDTLWSLDDVIAKIDELAPAPKARGPYKKRGDEISN